MTIPSSDIDLFSDEVLLSPYESYRKLRDLGPAVWLDSMNGYAVARHHDVRRVLQDGETFTSSEGVSMNETINAQMSGTLISSNGDRHATLRKIIEAPVRPAELNALRERISREADSLVASLVKKGRFDAATDLAKHLPVTIVSKLVGLPEEGRERMLDWSRALGNAMAPARCPRSAAAMPVAVEMMNYIVNECVPGKLKPDGWADRIWKAADRGEISPSDPFHMMNDYLGPSLDTTISATTSIIWLFTQFPDQWQLLRERPQLVPLAINEAVRLESPIQAFSRKLTRDVEFDGDFLSKGSRLWVIYASANRDERFWSEPERFNLQRENLNDHVGFGFGEHRCVGMNLARMEIAALLQAFLKKVDRFELVDLGREANAGFRVIDRCVVTVH